MKYNIASPYFPDEDIDAISDQIRALLRGDGLLSMGKNVSAFEKEFAEYAGTRYAVATSSCTSALEISLQAIEIGNGDEVVVPVQTFIATGSAVVRCGAKPVFCEANEDFLIDVDDVKRRITSRTKAVVVVHFAGLVHPGIVELRRYLADRGIRLVEDAAHAHGATAGGVAAGGFGDAACFSFYSTKIMTTGEGGMITTNDERIYRSCASIRSRGLDIGARDEIYPSLGMNGRLTEIQGILGRHQLRRLESFVGHRNRIASRYAQSLKPLLDKGMIRLQRIKAGSRHAYWRYVILLGNDVDRSDIIRRMAELEIRVDAPYEPLLHLQPVFKKMYGTSEGMFPYSENNAKRHICLPMHMRISEEHASYIGEALHGALRA
jgi:perosamine synthetase